LVLSLRDEGGREAGSRGGGRTEDWGLGAWSEEQEARSGKQGAGSRESSEQ